MIKRKNYIPRVIYIIILLTGVALMCFISREIIEKYPFAFASRYMSTLICHLLYLITAALFIRRSRRRKRHNASSLIFALLVPLGLCLTIGMYRYMPWSFNWLMIITLALALAYAVMIFKLRSRPGKLRIALRGAKKLILFSFVIASAILIINTYQNEYLAVSPVSSHINDTQDWSAEGNIETIAMLDEKTWQKLNLKEKLHVLGIVRNVEMASLNINDVELFTDYMEDGTMGYFLNEPEYIVEISIDHLVNASAQDVLSTLLHELKHANDQHYVDTVTDVDALNLRERFIYEQLKENLSNPINAFEDYYGYYFQYSEISARAYATNGVIKYQQLIEQYKNS